MGGVGMLLMTTSDDVDAPIRQLRRLLNVTQVPCMVVATIDFKDKRSDAGAEARVYKAQCIQLQRLSLPLDRLIRKHEEAEA